MKPFLEIPEKVIMKMKTNLIYDAVWKRPRKQGQRQHRTGLKSKDLETTIRKIGEDVSIL